MAFFSIIIPCYNQAHFLQECLMSIQNQSFTDWEAIVVNDGSPDNTTMVSKKILETDPRIRLVEKENGGLSSARNKGIELAKGDFLIFLDADDLILKDCLSRYHNLALENREFIQSDYLCFKDNINNILFKRTKIPQYSNFLTTILQGNVGPVNGFMISKKIVERVGKFDESLTSCEDWDFWIRCAKLGYTPFVVNEIFAAYRFVSGSMGKNSIRMLKQGFRVINIHYLGEDSVCLNYNCIDNFIDYGKTIKKYLLFSVGIALFNNQKIELNLIKDEYFNKKTIKLSVSDFSGISNYQTFRNLNTLDYFIFYYKRYKDYNQFFYFLLINKFIDHSTYKSIKEIIPNPFYKIFHKIRVRLKMNFYNLKL